MGDRTLGTAKDVLRWHNYTFHTTTQNDILESTIEGCEFTSIGKPTISIMLSTHTKREARDGKSSRASLISISSERISLERVLVESVEDGREVALAGIGEEGYDVLALVLGTLSELEGGIDSSSGRDADKEALGLRELAARTDGVIVLDRYNLVDNGTVESFGDEACTDTLNLMRTALAAREDG